MCGYQCSIHDLYSYQSLYKHLLKLQGCCSIFASKDERKLRSIIEKLYLYLAGWQVLCFEKGERVSLQHFIGVLHIAANKLCSTSRQ